MGRVNKGKLVLPLRCKRSPLRAWGSIPPRPTNAGVGQWLDRDLAKVDVMGSIPIARSTLR